MNTVLNTVLYLINIICQVISLDKLFHGKYLEYGLKFNREFLFPTVTFCDFTRYGYSENPETRTHTCYLPTNLFHQWFFLVLWYLVAVSAILLTCELVYSVISFFCPSLRLYVLKRKAGTKITQEQITELLSNLTTMSHNAESFFLQVLFQNLSDTTISDLFEYIWILLYLMFMLLMINHYVCFRINNIHHCLYFSTC